MIHSTVLSAAAVTNRADVKCNHRPLTGILHPVGKDTPAVQSVAGAPSGLRLDHAQRIADRTVTWFRFENTTATNARSGYFAFVRAPQTEDATRVRYQRSNERRRASELIQVWKSEVTGREFEVRESRSYAPSTELAPGAQGYLDFTAGTPAVTRKPLERSARLDRYYGRQLRSMQDGEGGPGQSRRNIGGWLIALALLLAVLWALL